MNILFGSDTTPAALRERKDADFSRAEEIARAILDDVRQNGDAALYRYCEQFDRAKLSSLAVTKEEIDAAIADVGEEFLAILSEAAANIRAYHSRQVRQGFSVCEQSGIVLGQRVLPLDRAGLYVPGGTASYPSTVLMNVIPAKLAGVGELILTTPPKPDGSVSPAILAAAYVAGVDKIFKVGGAQAIAALAYGTESIPKVDKITGPGNVYVAAAKRLVYGLVDIDMVAGPSEILVIADETADPVFVAADMLSQAEHDTMAASILLTPSERIAAETARELDRQLPLLPRRGVAESSMRDNGRIVVLSSLAEAVEWSNTVAPEHLELCVADPFALLGSVRHAGSVFLGNYAPEALGDYFAGPNHTLPTNGTARFASPLSVDDFVKKSSFVYYTKEVLVGVSRQIQAFAHAEGLDAHARSIALRMGLEERL